MSFGGGGARGLGLDAGDVSVSRRAPPPSVTCHVCGRGYGTASFSIHLKSCSKRFLEEQAKLPAGKRRPLPAAPSADLSFANPQAVEQWNEGARIAHEEAMVDCAHCGRTFSDDTRLAIHHRSCSADRPAKRVGERGVGNGGAPTVYALPGSPARGGLAPAGSADEPASGPAQRPATVPRLEAASSRGKEAEEGDDVRRDERGSTRVVVGGASAGGIASDAAGRDDAWRTSIIERFELLTERLDEIEARMVGDMREIRFELRELIEELHTAES